MDIYEKSEEENVTTTVTNITTLTRIVKLEVV